MVLKKIIKLVRSPQRVLNILLSLKIFRLIPDRRFIKIRYWLVMGKHLNLHNPQLFNEKMQWLKLYDRKVEYKKLVDKFEVRDYVATTIGKEYLIPLLGVYDTFYEINFETLPDQFVLKPTHTSGDVFICKDKAKIDEKKLKKMITKWMKRQYYWEQREWQYRDLKPRIICEQYMDDGAAEGLTDYKLMCFDGQVRYIFVCSNRYSERGLNIDIYDDNWQMMPYTRRCATNGREITKPDQYDNMRCLAERFAQGLIFLRVDFYIISGYIYFGELTLHPGSGFEAFSPEQFDQMLGSRISLPINKEEGGLEIGRK